MMTISIKQILFPVRYSLYIFYYSIFTFFLFFNRLLKRVDQSEENVIEVVTKIENILTKLEGMDKSKIKRRETMSRLIDSIISFMDNPNGGSRRFRSEASLYRPKSQAANTSSAMDASQASIKASSLSIKVDYNI